MLVLIGWQNMFMKTTPDIAVIILSGYSEFEYAQSAIKYQVNEHILKPAAKEKLLNLFKMYPRNRLPQEATKQLMKRNLLI